jgi:hypothetical protein
MWPWRNFSKPAIVLPIFFDTFDDDNKYNFFDQVTNGQEINDVVHAKLVDSTGDKVQYISMTTIIGSKRKRIVYGGTYRTSSSQAMEVFSNGRLMYYNQMYYSYSGSSIRGYHMTGLGYSCVFGKWLMTNDRGDRVWGNEAMLTLQAASQISGAMGKVTAVTGDVPFQRGDPVAIWYDSEKTYKSQDEMYEYMLVHVRRHFQFWAAMTFKKMKHFGWRSLSQVHVEQVLYPPNLRNKFLLGEVGIHSEGVDPMLLGNGLQNGSYWRNLLIQHAYYSALQSVPKLNDNSISNIIEIVSFIKALVLEHRISIPKRLGSAWLAYRYSYGTSKMDAEDAIKFMRSNSAPLSLSKGQRVSSGSYTCTVQDTDITCRCRFEISSSEVETLDKIWSALYTYGLSPNFYVVWDMIPYSFIVDWFIPVGDMLSVLDTEREYMSGKYNIKNVCFSFTYFREVENGYIAKFYTRWRSEPLEAFNQMYWFEKPSTSSKVVAYRVLDAASLVIG